MVFLLRSLEHANAARIHRDLAAFLQDYLAAGEIPAKLQQLREFTRDNPEQAGLPMGSGRRGPLSPRASETMLFSRGRVRTAQGFSPFPLS